jgi:hypothetical protein
MVALPYGFQIVSTFNSVFNFDPHCLRYLVDGVEALAASWYSCTRNTHIDNLETRAWVAVDFCRIVRAGGRDEEVSPLRSTQHHRISVGGDPDTIRNLSAFADPHHTVLALRIGAPHAALGV